MNKLKFPFYLSTLFIACVSFFSLLGIPVLVALLLVFLQSKFISKEIERLLNNQIEVTKSEYKNEAERIIKEAEALANERIESTNNLVLKKDEAQIRLDELLLKIEDLEKKESNLLTKVNALRLSQKSIKNSVENYRLYEQFDFDTAEIDTMYPTITIPIHSYDVKSLKQKSTQVKKEIKDAMDSYHQRYTTKTNRALYELIVLSLQSELQNILSSMKYGTLEKAVDAVKTMCVKYSKIANDGNQSISGTVLRFIGEIEYLFISLVEIEYEYYVKREQEKEEQRLLKEQMRQEAEELNRLKEEKKKLDAEEQKYQNEIQNIEKILSETSDSDKITELQNRLLELQNFVEELEHKKDEIINLQNGKAGNVYIISNIGSFGEEVFKIGMTRRLDPEERIKELSSASVPFPFDVHSFIFSNDAPALESKIHNTLAESRVNKVNPRKEFFKTSIDDIEKLVNELDPSAEFKRTIHAYEFFHSQEISKKENAS